MDDSAADDADLLSRFAHASDQAAFAQVVARHQDLVRRACLRRLGPADAEDAAQAVFIILSRKPAEAVRHGCLAAWLQRTAHHVACNAVRRRASRRAAETQASQEARMCSDPEPAQIDDPERLRGQLDAAVERLPEAQRQVVVLHYFSGLDHEAVARELGCPINTVYTRLHRALAKLRGQLAPGRECGLSASAVGALLADSGRLTLPKFPPIDPHSASATAHGLATTTLHGMLMTKIALFAAGIVLPITCAIAGVMMAAEHPAPLGAETPPRVAPVEAVEPPTADVLDPRVIAGLRVLDRVTPQALAASPLPDYYLRVRFVDPADASAYPIIQVGWMVASVNGAPPRMAALPKSAAELVLVDRQGGIHPQHVDSGAAVTGIPQWSPALTLLRTPHDKVWSELALLACERREDDPGLARLALVAARARGWKGEVADCLDADLLWRQGAPMEALKALAVHEQSRSEQVQRLRLGCALAAGRGPVVAEILQQHAAIFAHEMQPRIGLGLADLAARVSDRPRGCAVPTGIDFGSQPFHATGNLQFYGGEGLLAVRDLHDLDVSCDGNLVSDDPCRYTDAASLRWRFVAGDTGAPPAWDARVAWSKGLANACLIEVVMHLDGSWTLAIPSLDLQLAGSGEPGRAALRLLAVDGQLSVTCQGRQVLSAPWLLPAEGVTAIIQSTRIRARLMARLDAFGRQLREPLAEAILRDDPSAITDELAKGRSVHGNIDAWCSPLGAATQAGRVRAFEALVQAGADVQARHGNNAHQGVLAACNGGHGDLLRRLAQLGVDVPTELGKHSWWPMVVLRFHDPDVVEAAIACGLKPTGARWLEAVARWKPPLVIVDSLVAAGLDLGWYGAILRGDRADLELRLRKAPSLVSDRLLGYTPLHWAVAWRRSGLITPLLAACAQVDAVDDETGQTPLLLAMTRTFDVEAVDRLLAAGADPTMADRSGLDALAACDRFPARRLQVRAAAEKLRAQPAAAGGF